jgi:hypothetical protein
MKLEDLQILRDNWEEWKDSPDHALWPELIEGFDQLLVGCIEDAQRPNPMGEALNSGDGSYKP